MGYKDDIEFYFDDTSNVVQFRSDSRDGYLDMGVNRKRYDEIKNRYYGK